MVGKGGEAGPGESEEATVYNGGDATGGDINIPGENGTRGFLRNSRGGNSFLGTGGASNGASGNEEVGKGYGGGGGGSASGDGGDGGGGGGYAKKTIGASDLADTVSYTVGSGGASGGGNSGDGANGIIILTEYYI